MERVEFYTFGQCAYIDRLLSISRAELSCIQARKKNTFGDPIETPLKPLNTILLSVMYVGFQGVCPQLGTRDCRETPILQAATRLMGVFFSV